MNNLIGNKHGELYKHRYQRKTKIRIKSVSKGKKIHKKCLECNSVQGVTQMLEFLLSSGGSQEIPKFFVGHPVCLVVNQLLTSYFRF